MKEDVDTDLYSRQIGTFGMETMGKLVKTKVLIIGMRGLGVETAKNIILSGPQSVDIYDPSIVKIQDLGSNFYLSEDDVGKVSLDDACVQKLSELNPYVHVSVLKFEAKNNFFEFVKDLCEKVKNYDVVVFTEIQPMNLMIMVDETCRKNNVKLIYGVVLGLTVFIFTDFGPEHIVYDENGEEPGTYIIKSISKDKYGTVVIDNVQGTNNLTIGDGDFVRFKGVEGMTELNGEKDIYQIAFDNFCTFRIGDTSKFHDYIKGGIAQQVIIPKKFSYYDFKTRSAMICDKYHPLNNSDFTKSGRAELLYLTFSCVHDFYCKNNFILPELNNMEQAKEILNQVKLLYDNAKKNKISWLENIQPFDEKVVLNTIRWARAEICPMVGFFGGVLAQEVIKVTGKYLPINQWLIFDFFEQVENVPENADRTLKGTRYDEQIAIFGNEIQKKIQESNLFMAGAGATGCEFLKNFAMMGFCTADGSLLKVTDMDSIEISNLSRQFLFRKKDVGKPKSICACKAVKLMNPKINVEGLEIKVCKETENIFNEDFWNAQTFIINAVDSVDARKYIDTQVIAFEKVSVDSGTLGTKAHSQLIVPHQTSTYADNAPEPTTKSIPMCTLRHFPSLIQHCIEWGRDIFYGYFTGIITEVKTVFSNFERFYRDIGMLGSALNRLEKVKTIKAHVDMITSQSLDKIVEYAIEQYTIHFDHNIQQLRYNYPPDYKNKDGTPFWSGSRKLPEVQHFDPKDKLELQFVKSFTQVLAHALGIKLTKEDLSDENLIKSCEKVKIPEFVSKIVEIETEEKTEEQRKKEEEERELQEMQELQGLSEEQSKMMEDAEKELDEIMNEFQKIDKSKFDVNLINQEEFEKDHDYNGHIDFIHAAANLRARGYKIEECDRNKTKMIAGKIIPTILTTTAAIAGQVSLELYSLFMTHDKKYLRNCFLNLRNAFFLFEEPNPPVVMEDKECEENLYTGIKYIPEKWNIWDKIEMKGSQSIEDFMKSLKEKYDIDIDILIANGETLLTSFMKPEKEFLEKKLEDLYYETTGIERKEKDNYLLVQTISTIKNAKIKDKVIETASVLMPPIKYIFK